MIFPFHKKQADQEVLLPLLVFQPTDVLPLLSRGQESYAILYRPQRPFESPSHSQQLQLI